MQLITFTDTKNIPEEYYPIPSSRLIPDWYKNLQSYVGDEKKPDGSGATTATAKRCMPIFDAITSGYIISTYTDIWVSQQKDDTEETFQYYEWSILDPIGFHPKEQLPEHPDGSGHRISYPKWINAWSIKTPPGYSCLFVTPLHRDTPIVILPGVVDTDVYTAPVNFPFILKNPKMEGLIPAGTPIAQVIPIKRDDWQMSIGEKDDLLKQEKITTKLRTKFFDSYKTQFRQIKQYK